MESRPVGDSLNSLTRFRIPTATYRLQFNSDFTFQQAKDLIAYFYELGISDCYASPIFKSRAGSKHGYDICDYSQVNPEIGGEEGFLLFSRDLEAQGLGLILDLVPNHMGIAGTCNTWWLDVLENGPMSNFSAYFDIEWHPLKPELENKVLLPILEDQYGTVLEDGKLQLAYENGAFFLCYYETRLPLTPLSYSKILSHQIEEKAMRMGEDNVHLQELRSILTALSYLPSPAELSPEKIVEQRREKEVIKRRIAALYTDCSNIRSAIDDALRVLNGIPGDPRSFDQLHELVDAQPYRPSYWRVATEEINYRRFFDINELAAIRVELPEVFQDTHQLVFRFLSEGKATGLRIDHPDGLLDPPGYFRRLQENYQLHLTRSEALGSAHSIAAAESLGVSSTHTIEESGLHSCGQTWPLYVMAEKILGEGEPLPEDWAIHGTTGYDFLNDVNGLFVDSSQGRLVNQIYTQFTRTQNNFRDLVNATKKMTMLVSMAGEINALSHRLERISEKNRRYRDFTLNSLTHAIREVIASLPVYRTYVTSQKPPSERDKTYIEVAIAEARRRNPRTARAIFSFIQDTLLFKNLEDFREEDRPQLISFVMRFQQLTGSVMAKGLEDTAFYVYNRFASLNEVGGNPERFGIPSSMFHSRNQERQRRWPHSLLATSTHDTKRSEDVRARINVLSEIPKEWRAALRLWSRINAPKKARINGTVAPDRNDEYLLYQTLLGVWPSEFASVAEQESFRDRIAGYMRKATKEAKVHTSWVNPNEAYDQAVQNFVALVLRDPESGRFAKSFRTLQRKVANYGYLNSLAQVILKLTSPGVPDIYQGNEIWDFSLVDPDNRRPVDYKYRCSLLQNLKQRLESSRDLVPLLGEMLNSMPDGRAKLYLIYKVLGFRRAHTALFAHGAYYPLEALGQKADHVTAFARTWEDDAVLVAAPRLIVRLTGGNQSLPLGREVWGNTWIALADPLTSEQSYYNVLTGEVIAVERMGGGMGLPLSAVLQSFPVALLKRVGTKNLQALAS